MKSYGLLVAFLLVLLGSALISSAPVKAVPEHALLREAAGRMSALDEKDLERWLDLIQQNQQASDWQKLHASNRFFNRLQWRSDWENWQQRDYWASPLEMLARRAGDCEDYAIAKYFTLIRMQVAPEKLRLVYSLLEGAEGGVNNSHMVLVYYASPGAEPLILDNLNKQIVPASARFDLKPIFAFNTGRKLEQALQGFEYL